MHKYDIIINYIKEQIDSKQFGYGEKIPSENELVQQFSLSRCTVRRAIELLTVQGLLEKRHGSGTYVKRTNLQKPRTNTIGILTTYLDDYIFPNIINAIENVLTQYNYTINLGITSNKVEKERVCFQSMLDHNVDGLIIEGTKSALPNPNLDLLRKFMERKIPVVFINSKYDAFDSSYVMVDDERSGFLAGEYLIKSGHKKIGAIFKSDDIQGHKRYQGFLRSMYEHNLHLDENAVVWYTTEDIPILFNGESDRVLLRRFSDSTAIICYNDEIAIKTLHLLEHGNRHVPDDCSIIGFDDSYLCQVSSVKLTSIAYRHYEMAQIAAKSLLELINGGKPVHKLLPSTLFERDSVKKLV